MPKPIVFRLDEIKNRLDALPEGGIYIKPFVTVKNCESMAGGLNFLNKVSVPWNLTCDEIIYCHEGTFRLMCGGEAFVLNPGDMMLVPKDNEIAYEADGKCVIFYAAYPVDWKQRAGLTSVPGIDPEDM
jgi:ethanolamine utilization protein EutQ